MTALPDPALLLLVGPSGSGKSTWAATRYRPEEIVSSDDLRSRVGSGPADLDASADAFAVLERVASARIGRRLLTVVDTLGFDAGLRDHLGTTAREMGMPTVAVLFTTDGEVCRARNRARMRPVPAGVLSGQIARMGDIRGMLAEEGWSVVAVDGGAEATPETLPPARSVEVPRDGGLGFHLHLSRFPSDDVDESVTAIAVTAEDAGFAGISVLDHLVQIPQVGREWDAMPEALALIGRLASVTSRVRLGALVSPVTFRHPVVLARQLATLDVLSGGRIECGLGAGWFDAEHLALGIDFPPASRRLDMLEDAAQLMPLVWGPGSPSFTGLTISVDRATGYPRPLNGTIPITIGGGGERRTLRIAARHADAWNVRADLDGFLRKRDVVLRHCADVGRDPDTLDATILDVTIHGRDRTDVADTIEATRGRTSAATFAERHHAGVTATHIDRFRALEAAGVRRVHVAILGDDPVRRVEDFAPVVAAFA